MKILKFALSILLAIAIWSGFIIYGLSEGFLLKPITSETTSKAFIEKAKEKVAEGFVGNLALILIEDGQVDGSYFHAAEGEVDQHTVFQMASISKWVTSWGVMALVEKGLLDLDAPIETYLTRWHLPESDFDHDEVTARRLLSHTAGLVDGLGYDGFGPNDRVQTLEESLTKAADAIYSDGEAKVGYIPGSRYEYSGASYTLLQLVIEEISGLSFQEYMQEEVFQPLGMSRSTFVLSDSLDWKMAKFYDPDGSLTQPGRFTALAAASLFTCPADLTKFIQAHFRSETVLSPASKALMIQAEGFRGNYGVHGLGPQIWGHHAPKGYVFGHDGSSDRPQLNTSARIHSKSTDAIIALSGGHPYIASHLTDHWCFWKAGIADFVVIHANKTRLWSIWAVGLCFILGLFVYLWRR